MRIDKVEIDGFGKLNNVSFTFADGVNLIYGVNESGKSTLCEFLLAAFYGLPNESKKTADDMPPRKKYRPWNTESFGGRVYFTDDSGKKLVIERSFKGTKRGDKTALRDADTWEELDNSDDLGEKLFGLSREGFLKTLYVKSFGADSLKSDDGEIMSRLSNLETSGAEDVSYSKIINAMEKEIFSLKTKTGRGGKISALEDKIQELNSELSISNMTYSALEADAQTAESLKTAATERENEAKLLEEKYNTALMYEKYIQSKKVAETKAVIEKRIAVSNEKLSALSEQINNLDKDESAIVSAEDISRARMLETKKLMAEEKLQEFNESKNSKPKNYALYATIPLLICCIIMLIFSIIYKSTFATILGVFSVLASVLAMNGFRLKNKKLQDTKNQEYIKAVEELESIKGELEKILVPYRVSVSDELSALFMASKSKDERRADLTKQYNDLKSEIEGLKNSIPQETDEEFPDDVMTYTGESSEVLFAKINMLKAESRQMQERSAEISVRLARETAEIRNEADIKAEIQATSQERDEACERYNALTRAAEWLRLAHEEIKNNFAPRLNQKASDLLAYLTSGKYADVRANDSFGINLKPAGGEIVEAGYMSRGTYDLLYIALRFAAMSVLTDGKIPLVILDDAFSQLDDTRLLAAADMISKNPEFSQVILFTCHENYKDILKNCHITELQ